MKHADLVPSSGRAVRIRQRLHLGGFGKKNAGLTDFGVRGYRF
jgi:hypothetical protein